MENRKRKQRFEPRNTLEPVGLAPLSKSLEFCMQRPSAGYGAKRKVLANENREHQAQQKFLARDCRFRHEALGLFCDI